MPNVLEEIEQQISKLSAKAVRKNTGTIASISDGVAKIDGLSGVMYNEMVQFPGGAIGIALNLEEDSVGCVVLGDVSQLKEGDDVSTTGRLLSVPVGKELLGRTVDALGNPVDGKGPLGSKEFFPVEKIAPGIIVRKSVSQPLLTGIMAIDSMIPIGRGQRELIIGDRETGKTAIATDAIINQRGSDVICVYVAIGQKSASVRQVIDAVTKYGDPKRCIFVVAGPATAPGLQWLAPYAGFSMAEYFRDQGGHVLIVVDDLTKHAATHRELSLLMRQPSGREAYPGDVFHIQARLLERAAKLSKDLGGGSLTALPIAQTEASNLSAYIPTNLISITDGQIVLSSKLFDEGQKPAVDIGLSVSRVGGKAQAPILKDLAETLRLDYAQFLEVELFTRFSTTLDARTQAQIDHGRRIRAILTQPRFAPLSLAHEAAEFLALHDGLLDALPLDRMDEFKSQLPGWLDKHCKGVLERLETERQLDQAERKQLSSATAALVETLKPVSAKAKP
jgi:F-type H+-transporting ATPase subunit alpha